jgi:hypothetical protein
MGNGVQPTIAPSDKVGKKKEIPQKIAKTHDDIAFARRFTRRPRDESAKNRKIDKKRKNSFFLNFLHVSNRTRVRNEV